MEGPLDSALFSSSPWFIRPLLWLGGKVSDRVLSRMHRQSYLNRMENDYEKLILTGIPSGLFSSAVELDKIFISLRLYPNRTRVDYPLSDEEIRKYRQNLESGIYSEELDRLIHEAERNWLNRIVQRQSITIASLWRTLTQDHPVAVIQGYPGMGKSTLMQRLTLHMARRSLNKHDSLTVSSLPSRSSPSNSLPLIPVFIRLKEYADAQTRITEDLPILEFWALSFKKYAPLSFIRRSLKRGMCLVIFDGLDEVSDPKMRKRIQQAINAFVRDWRNASSDKRRPFNRFLITSRVAGYDQEAFAELDAEHYIIADLTKELILDFLPRWGRAAKAEEEMRRFSKTISEDKEIERLAENPLLLTLMAVMQQNSIVLPRQRAELYDTITRTLLENRNLAKGIDPIEEAEAIRRLGLLAYEMQTNNDIAREKRVKEVISGIMANESDHLLSEKELKEQVDVFIKRVRERSGLFVQRAGDYFSFFHRSFQEYFAARYILNEIQEERAKEAARIDYLVAQARRLDDLWREPFLLAVAYQSARGRDVTVARKMLQALLDESERNSSTLEQRLHDLLLTADAVVETRPVTIDKILEQRIAQSLLTAYLEAQQREAFEDCQKIERAIRLWLLALSPEDSYSALLLTLIETLTLKDEGQHTLQRATLTLLIMILYDERYPQSVYDTLIPLLLGLADLPPVSHYQPVAHSILVDYTVADLALTALSRMGSSGPAGLLLEEVRKHWIDYPEHLRLLARVSLESGILLSPVAVPLDESKYERYLETLDRWFRLKERCEKRSYRSTNEDVLECQAIHRNLLACAEEVRYPMWLHLRDMLANSCASQDQSWQNIQLNWQHYLSEQLTTGPYVSYQEIILLWESLFPAEQGLRPAMDLLASHYTRSDSSHHHYALRFFAALSVDWQDVLYIISEQNGPAQPRPQAFHKLQARRFWQHWRLWRDMRDIQDILYLQNLAHFRKKYDLEDWRYWRYWRYVEDLDIENNAWNIVNWRYWRYRRELKAWQERGDWQKGLSSLNALLPINTVLLRRSQIPGRLQVPRRVGESHWADLQAIRKWQSVSDVQSMQKWRDTLPVFPTAEQALQLLRETTDQAEACNLTTILLGWLLLIQENGDIDESKQIAAEDIQHIVAVTMQKFAATPVGQKELRESLLDILRFLPARSGEEVRFVRQLAEASADEEIQQALAQAFKFAGSLPTNDWNTAMRDAALSSTVLAIRKAALDVLAPERSIPARRSASSVRIGALMSDSF